ncbi:hypothetical protein K7X08_002703 [Anisodus acutangulus]|uniref:Uncharacterized protein n=1 Tax=Anisodus acutangulus TaxID=402998 RepID=A0A9Q1L0K3_9SOLA|nr:hypothetical protein K7X08_002703 [Anisodus acutangulus]
MEISPMSKQISTNIPANTPTNTPMSTSPPMNTESSAKNEPQQPGRLSSSPSTEDLSKSIVFKGLDEPLDISYPGDNNNPIDVDETSDISALGKRPGSSTFPTRRSSRMFEITVREESSNKRSRFDTSIPACSSSDGDDTDFVLSTEENKREPTASVPQDMSQ